MVLGGEYYLRSRAALKSVPVWARTLVEILTNSTQPPSGAAANQKAGLDNSVEAPARGSAFTI